MNQQTKKSLTLPRPLVNKILAHAQQSTDNKSNAISCGVISKDSQDNKFYYPVVSQTTQTKKSPCFSESDPAFKKIIQHIENKQQQIFACVFTSSEKIETASIDKKFFSINQHYYILNSLDTKGVLSMQAIYRDDDLLQEVELALAVDDSVTNRSAS